MDVSPSIRPFLVGKYPSTTFHITFFRGALMCMLHKDAEMVLIKLFFKKQGISVVIKRVCRLNFIQNG